MFWSPNHRRAPLTYITKYQSEDMGVPGFAGRVLSGSASLRSLRDGLRAPFRPLTRRGAQLGLDRRSGPFPLRHRIAPQPLTRGRCDGEDGRGKRKRAGRAKRQKCRNAVTWTFRDYQPPALTRLVRRSRETRFYFRRKLRPPQPQAQRMSPRSPLPHGPRPRTA